MSQSSTETKESSSRSAEQTPSFGHPFLVWVLVGSSLLRLGMDLYRAAPASVPVTEVSAGLLFATVIVAALWVAGVRPPLRASALYFVAEQAVYLSLALAFVGTEPGPWRAAGFHALSIAGAAALSFTDPGRRSRRWLRHRGWRLLRWAAKTE